jgi:hypothetical protein
VRFATFLLAAVLSAQAQQDWLIVPGVRVGPITASTSMADLRKIFGASAVVDQDIYIGEDVETPGTVINEKNGPSKSLGIVWKGPKSRRVPDLILICWASGKGNCAWRTASGIGIGTTLKYLEGLNGRAFTLAGFAWDREGMVTSWEGGRLALLTKGAGGLLLRLRPRGLGPLSEGEYRSVMGAEQFSSSNPVMQKANPEVFAMEFQFPK